ncbi:hypothetical protein H2202_006762 [Exophiala xenobiotica]|nr:hypothetical protein H2202_006762 [Exophiala xenobiotica]KAK5238869.1 hypothetical protein LTR47_000612 [Exophiala xenobiotica]KAK5255791.1 hypothetical protein LTS06_000247 [Exophiala xenobiotica]KAK5283904.1 hypothetical protein LTR40_001048 [Exophiala xenobiotica]KAK5350300.1 hypothetical protein LTR61_006275 [Exophiala xenobiotica]
MSVTAIFDWLGLEDTLPRVKLTTLPASYFRFPPSPKPTTLPPPPDSPTLAHPFTIPTDIYNAVLSPNVPITVALVYMSFVAFMNSVNANRKYKPWAFSKTRFFKLLVILHNVFLAAYSTWTFIGMVNTLRLCLPAWNEQPTVVGTVDALCKLHGPRGMGGAATYNATTSAWSMTNRLFHLAADGLGPETTDAGRIWNEGLAFYGWLFYLSKFYEVIDTCIILAKGRKSSILQTYHHAGAMLSMWAGIRYMSPPIWMFVLVNSGIHAVMYSFYLFSTLGIRVPKWFKQTLTTFQISQFVVGVIYAFSHLFVAYRIPVSVAYTYYPGEVASKIAYSLPSDLSATASSALATASAGVGSWLKKAALRAAGYEGLAENVLNEQGRPFGIDAVHAAEDLVAREETRFRDELQWVHCLDTSGQVFAILLNCMYLLPLTWLFGQFFITSYLKRGETRRNSSASELAVRARQSLQDASKGVARRLSEAVEEMHRTSEDIGEEDAIVDTEEVKNELGQVAQQVKNTAKKASKKARQAASKANTETVVEEFQRDLELMKEGAMNLGEKIKTATSSAVDQAKNLKDATVEQTQKTADAAEDATTTATQKGKKTTKQAKDLKNSAAQKAEKSAQQAKDVKDSAAKDVKDSAAEKTKKTTDKAEDAAAEAGDKGEKKARDIKEETEKSSAETSKKEKAPNGSGTGAEEATGQTSPQPKSDEVQSDEHEVETSEVQEGKSFADALKE